LSIPTACGSGNQFCTAGTFTNARAGFVAATYNGYFYIASGESNGNTGSCTSADGNGFWSCKDAQYAQIKSDGTLGSFSSAGTFSTAREWAPGAVYGGYMFIVGGQEPVFSFKNTTLYTQINSPEQTATYEKIIDVGGSGTITGLSFNGTAVCGMPISYRLADSTGVFGSVQNLGSSIPGVTYNIANGLKRYIWVQFKMNDAVCGTQSTITDFTVTYNISPSAPTLSTPSAGATGVSALPQFQLRTTDADNDYLKYWIDVCSTSNCSSIVRSICQTNVGSNLPGTCSSASQTGWSGQDQQTSTAYTGNSVITSSTMAIHNYQVAPLTKNTQYWWRAYAIDPGGTNTWSSASAIQTFTTGDDPPAPPTLLYPVTTSTGNSVFTTFQLRSAEYNSDYVEYWIDVCSTSNCSSIVRSICQYSAGTGVPGTCTTSQVGWGSQNTQNGTAYTGNPTLSLSQLATHNYQAPYLTKNTQYWWRAYAIDPGGSNTWSSASPISTFTTAPTETHIQGNIKFQGNVSL